MKQPTPPRRMPISVMPSASPQPRSFDDAGRLAAGKGSDDMPYLRVLALWGRAIVLFHSGFEFSLPLLLKASMEKQRAVSWSEASSRHEEEVCFKMIQDFCRRSTKSIVFDPALVANTVGRCCLPGVIHSARQTQTLSSSSF